MPDKKCPRCGLWNTDSALQCDCGFDFETGTVEKSYNKREVRQSPPNLRRTLLYGIGAGVSLLLSYLATYLVDQLFNSSHNDLGELILSGIFMSLFLFITIMFFFKEIRTPPCLEIPQTGSQKQDKILLFILLALSGVGIFSLWMTAGLFRPDIGQGAIFALICIPMDCIYVGTASAILWRLYVRRNVHATSDERSTEDREPKQD